MTRPARLARTVLLASLVIVAASAAFPPMFPLVLLVSVFAVLVFVHRRERV